MISEELRISGTPELAAKLYLPDKEHTWPGILLCHGFASSKEEHMALPQALCQAGFGVMTFDFRGHGQSAGAKAYVSSLSHLDDTGRAYQRLLECPHIDHQQTALMGHSLGTAAVLRFLGTRLGQDVKAAVLLAPPYQLRLNVKPAEKVAYTALAHVVGKPMMSLLKQHLYIPYRIAPEDIYISAEAITRAKTMKLLAPVISVNNYDYLMTEQDNVIYAEKVHTPILVMAAQQDKIIPVAHSEEVFKALASKDKQWVVMADSGHSLLGDRQAKQVATQVIEWLQSRLRMPQGV